VAKAPLPRGITVVSNPGGIEIERVRSSARRSSCDDTRILDATVTGSGYNPLTQDFANTKFFLS